MLALIASIFFVFGGGLDVAQSQSASEPDLGGCSLNTTLALVCSRM
jgi:hypothetical protein